jgi:DNA modification methylase
VTTVTCAGWAMHLGDCLEVMPHLERVDHICTDPPYEAEAHTKARRSLKDATQRKGGRNTGVVRRIDAPLEIDFAAITDEDRSYAAECMAGLAKRWCVAFCQAEAIAAWRASFVNGGLDWVRSGIWVKPNGAPQFTGDRPGQGYESLAIAHQPGRKRWNGGGRHAVWTVPLDHHAGGGREEEHVLEVEAEWDSVVRRATLQVDTEASPPRVTAVSGTGDASEWSTWLCGSGLTVLSLLDSRSTTATETSSTTASRTWRRFLRSNISASTPGANCETESGGSPAPSAEHSTRQTITTARDKGIPFPGAGRAPCEASWRLSSGGARPAGHPTRKPLALMLALVEDFTDPGDTILDPFAGSGTTGVAAIRLGRKFVGIERDPKYFALAVERLRAEEAGSTVSAQRAGQLALLGGA